MICREIAMGASRLLGNTYDEPLDFETRSSFILAAMASETAYLDKQFREANGLDPQPEFDYSFINLDLDFPLSDRFISAAKFYLASLLIIDTNEELSDLFFERYCDSVCSISNSIPAKLEKTSNVY